MYLALAIENKCQFVTADETYLRKLYRHGERKVRDVAVSLIEAVEEAMRKSNFACGSSDPWLLPVNELPPDWTTRVTHTQAIGNQWLDSTAETLLFVPSVILPIANMPDLNMLINRVAEAHQLGSLISLSLRSISRLFRL